MSRSVSSRSAAFAARRPSVVHRLRRDDNLLRSNQFRSRTSSEVVSFLAKGGKANEGYFFRFKAASIDYQIVGPEPRGASFASSVIRRRCSVAPWPGQLRRYVASSLTDNPVAYARVLSCATKIVAINQLHCCCRDTDRFSVTVATDSLNRFQSRRVSQLS